MRSGSEVLSVLAAPLNVEVLRALEEEPTQLPELRRALGHPPVTTMRSYLRKLTEMGVIERHREDDFPGSVSYAITPAGLRLLAVGEIVESWLRSAPDGPLELGDTAGKSAIKALVDGWSTGIVRALAARPLALTELDRVIPQVSYPTLERRLTAMRQVGLIAPEEERAGRVTRCAVTAWLRHAVAPLTSAAGWEAQCIASQVPAPGRIDAEAVFLLAVPLLELPSEVDGTCRLAVEFKRGSELDFAGVTVGIEEGRVRSCVSRVEGSPDAWATGSVLDWFRWMRGMNGHRIEIGGDTALANVLAEGLRGAVPASSAN